MIILKNYYEEDEKLFSTGDSELDDILEEVYYSGLEDGYDYAQKEFGLNANGLKNKVKGSVRHLKRSAKQKKAGLKMIIQKDLSPEEVKSLAVVARTGMTPGTKTARKVARTGRRMEKLGLGDLSDFEIARDMLENKVRSGEGLSYIRTPWGGGYA